ncbi:hypothetical protein INT45_014191 [Circinella minor]|uniref:SH3 domain-containing protein n=1 Tax=Circinella minor TaxID=1195481 RepID=A0A8H7VIX0_9FUNG|nr:hypothetical protein INT45_014191 [Circinella minor]
MVTRSAQELTDDISRAVQILTQFTDPSKRDVRFLIPQSVLANAHGLMFIRLYRGGFMVSAKKGTGVIIARLPDGSWSAPSGISMGALGFGHQAGVEMIDSIIVMNYRGAVKAFFDGGGQLQLGASMSVSAGPLGRAADISASTANGQHISATYAYSSSKGLFIGYSFEGSKISERVNTNAAFYGRSIHAKEILTGTVAPPPQAQRLYQMLESLGAGPRPGLPFAPKKGRASMPPVPSSQQQQQQSPSFNQQSPQRHSSSFYQSPPPTSPYHNSSPQQPQQHYNNIPGGTGVDSNTTWQQHSSFQKPPENNNSFGFDEPPPPYAPSSKDQDTFGNMANTNDVKHPNSSEVVSPNESNIGVQQHQQQQSSVSPSTQAPLVDTSTSNNNAAPGYTASSGFEQFYGNDMKKDSNPFEQQQPENTVVIAKYDFPGEQPDDLTFSAGDVIIVTQRKGDRQAWWEGEIGSRKGMFPANYTEDMS